MSEFINAESESDSSHFADFGWVEKLVVILLTFGFLGDCFLDGCNP